MPPKKQGGAAKAIAPAAPQSVEVVGGKRLEETMFFKKLSQVMSQAVLPCCHEFSLLTRDNADLIVLLQTSV